MKALLDADIYSFRAAFSAETDEVWVATSRVDKMVEDTLFELGITEYELWLSGKGNFRYNVFPEYKANRIKVARPKWEHEVKAHLVKNWQANWSEGCEADDMLGIRQATSEPESTIICSIDKDLDMIPGWHYNFVKKEKYYVTPEEATRWFYYQLMVGDSADGIKGCSGIGPKKADKFLSSCASEKEMYEGVLDLYGCYQEMLMNSRCLWIWQKENDNIEERWKEKGFYTEDIYGMDTGS